MPDNLIEKLSRESSEPGVYLMEDAEGKVIYVGKARNLKKRLASYFARTGHQDMKTSVLIEKISAYHTIITGTEQEALLLEANLIRRHKPRYNIILKDDKRYPCLRLDMKHPYPSLSIVRKMENDGALYFGPFASPRSVHETLKMINKTFKLRKCGTRALKSRSRACLNYQMGACLGPCCLDVDPIVYNKMVQEVVLLLKGRMPELIQKIKNEMVTAARAQDYENAAALRDRMFALENILEKQVSVTTDGRDRDVLGIARVPGFSLITLLFVRGGHLLGSQSFEFSDVLSTDAEMVGTFVRQYYENKTHFIPKEILVPCLPEDAFLLEAWLKTIKGEKVSILRPRRGEKVRLIQMAVQNAENEMNEIVASAAAQTDMLIRLQKRLRLVRLPERIECFDNSNISGTTPVAGMVVFEKAKPHKPAYRKYKIRTVTEPDDYAYMAEVLKRRYGKGDQSAPFPDILMVDGGKGQLNIAVSVTRELGLEGRFDIIGIAKKDETIGETQDKIYQPGRANPVNFAREDDLLHFLQRIRDEAHRHVISFHRKRRGQTGVRSVLDTIPGIGKKRKQALLRHFGSVKNIRTATLEEISALPGMTHQAAEAVKKKLQSHNL